MRRRYVRVGAGDDHGREQLGGEVLAQDCTVQIQQQRSARPPGDRCDLEQGTCQSLDRDRKWPVVLAGHSAAELLRKADDQLVQVLLLYGLMQRHSPAVRAVSPGRCVMAVRRDMAGVPVRRPTGCGQRGGRPGVALYGRPVPSRFLTLDGVGEVLSVSRSQAHALVRRGELRAIKVGGRGVWRVERAELEAFIAAAYAATREPETAGEDRGDRGGNAGDSKQPRDGAGDP